MSDYSTERQLAELQRLRNSGQMSPSEYQQERAYLLDRLAQRAQQAFELGDSATARGLFEESAGMGHVESLVWVGYMTEQEGDVAAGLRLYERAADQGSGLGACYLGDRAGAARDYETAARWFERAVELGFAPARPRLGEARWRLGDRVGGEALLRSALREGDPDAIEILALFQQKADEISDDEFATRMEQAAERRLVLELERQAWAQVEDLSTLTNEEMERWDEEFKHWCAQDDALMAVFLERGEGALPDPLRDGDKLRARTKCNIEWRKRRIAHGERRLERAEADRSEAEQAKQTFIAQHAGEMAASAQRSQGPTRDLEIRGCRLLAGADGAVGVVTVRFAAAQPLTITLRGRPWTTIQWDEIESIAVEALAERSRVTASRAVGLGLLSLAAKKRTPWCVMTIVWGARHLVFEVPVEAHRLQGELATAGLLLAT